MKTILSKLKKGDVVGIKGFLEVRAEILLIKREAKTKKTSGYSTTEYIYSFLVVWNDGKKDIKLWLNQESIRIFKKRT